MTSSAVVIPSLIEISNTLMQGVSQTMENGIQLYENGSTYLIGNLALSQGLSPYRNINSSPQDVDYQLLAKAGILIGTDAKQKEIVLTTGFPFATYELFKQQATQFFTLKDIVIEYNSAAFSSGDRKKMQVTVKNLQVMPEVAGSVTAIRKGEIGDDGDFFIVSLGYGTCETALSTKTGLVSRTCLSTNGLRYAVNTLYKEVATGYNVGVKNEHLMNQSFQSGRIVLDRKRKDLSELRKKHLESYYKEIVSPTLRKAFTDNDFEKSTSLYLVGGGAMYEDLVTCFETEFSETLDIKVPEAPHNIASLGYYLNSVAWAESASEAIGIDIGNAYTVVTKAMPTLGRDQTVPIFSDSAS